MKIRKDDQQELINMLRRTAPGTLLRDGLENVLRAQSGGLIVLGEKDRISPLTTGGFEINAPYTPAHLYELAKMDGAIILSADGQRIISANAHLNPDAAIPSAETGIRHRTAEQTAKQTGDLVICISQRRSVITLYKGHLKYVLRDTGMLLNTANQAIQTLEKYRGALEGALLRLSLGEYDGTVSLSDVLQVIQRAEIFNRVSDELTRYVTELGNESRLVRMQSEELIANVEKEERLTIRDYVMLEKDVDEQRELDRIVLELRQCSHEDLLNMDYLAGILGYYGSGQHNRRDMLSNRGFRLMYKIPRLPAHVVENVVLHFNGFEALRDATVAELDEVEGVGQVRAKQITRGLERLRAQVISDGHWE